MFEKNVFLGKSWKDIGPFVRNWSSEFFVFEQKFVPPITFQKLFVSERSGSWDVLLTKLQL